MSRRDVALVALAYLSFVTLGMGEASIGVLWSPHIMTTFDQSIGNLGALLLAVTTGYVSGSIASGKLFVRYQPGTMLGIALLLTASAFLGYSNAPSYGFMVACGLLLGAGAGLLDGGMNIYFAAYYNARLMNWLHAAFGIGALLSPQLVNLTVFARNGSWREAYLVMAMATAVVSVLYFASARHWRRLQASTDEAPAVPMRATLRLPILWIGILTFLCYTGNESSAGTWSAPFFTAQGVEPLIANNWVTAYWFTFTMGRLIFGTFITRLNPDRVIRICLMGAFAGAVLIVWRPIPEAMVIGIMIYGFMLSPIFALMITGTQTRLGPALAPGAIGLQVAAASLGGSLFQGMIGRATERFGLDLVPWIFAMMSLVLLAVYHVSQSPRFDIRKAKSTEYPVPSVEGRR